ncbi:cellulose biosynthesis cyclic di-GMP-binding regulatory protein BcsB [Methylorubrum salsuginis]|uniref:Cyclic di-GMP-binding protein n=1 Tax=Methylorubrum salsuginis TaxID=414703 RepID=A0A1I4IPK2_9HYPH|nr:cellulose biosynthesis cyclic di-GMP-binding regulatory protein BcsB [Methylorubrum salsuginis]SFL56288.1 cellulose synthase subunit [Methylorubrum salsuginis]
MRFALPLVLALLGGTAAAAQSFSGYGPARPMLLPQAPGREAAAEAPTRSAPVLRRPGSVAASLRLAGENGAVTLPLTVTEAEARAGGRFQLGYLSAISVLPEASTLTVSINGTEIGGVAIDGAREPRNVAFDVPPGLLARGVNAVRVGVVQRHRVDCSVAATYELWTQIDRDTTGFLPAAEVLPGLDDLAAFPLAADGAMPIRLIQAGGRLSARGVEHLLAALQATVLAGRFGQPRAQFVTNTDGDGLALAAAPAGELAEKIDLSSLGAVTGPVLALLPAANGRAATLVATGRDEAEVDAALVELARRRVAAPPGTPAGLRALAEAEGRPVEGGVALTLADLGFADQRVSARSHRIEFDLALPHDILAADYDRLTLDLDGAYAAGLDPEARISVEINGASAGSTPLAKPRGESFARRTVLLPLRLLRPGLNHVTILAELPRAQDAACTDHAVAPERLRLAASTRLTIPPLARIARQPELAASLEAGFPYAEGARRPTLAVPAPDRDSMAAAATVAARLAVAAGRPIPFAFAAGRGSAEGPTVMVAPARLLDPATVTAAGLDPQALREAWTGREAMAAAAATPAARRRALRQDGIAACRAPRPAAPEAPAEAAPDLGGASAVLAQAVTGPQTDDLLTLVTAPSPAALRDAVDCLVHPRVWSRPQGRLAMLSAADGTVVVRPAEAPRYVPTAPPSLANLRRVLAGWLSLNAGFYGLAALLVAACLAGFSRLLVRQLGRRSS